jgi:hypothetical protein
MLKNDAAQSRAVLAARAGLELMDRKKLDGVFKYTEIDIKKKKVFKGL